MSKELLPEVRVVDKGRRELKSLIQTRDKFAELPSSLKNKIHGILLEHGIQSKREIFTSQKILKEVSDKNMKPHSLIRFNFDF